MLIGSPIHVAWARSYQSGREDASFGHALVYLPLHPAGMSRG